MNRRMINVGLDGMSAPWRWGTALLLIAYFGFMDADTSAQIVIPTGFPIDADGNGTADTWLIDRDGDGKPDFIVADRNEDGQFDMVLIDDFPTGNFDQAMFDEDFDGFFEKEWKDQDKNGVPTEDEIYIIPEPIYANILPGLPPSQEDSFINYSREVGQLVTYACSQQIINEEFVSDGDCDGTPERYLFLIASGEQLPGFFYDVDEDGTFDAALLRDAATKSLTELWQDSNNDAQIQSPERTPITANPCSGPTCAEAVQAFTAQLATGLDIDGDSHTEQLLLSETIPWFESFAEDSNSDEMLDRVTVGTDEGATFALIIDRNQDERDEIVLLVTTLALGTVEQREIFVDGQPDLIAIGVGEQGALATINATVIVVEDPDRLPQQPTGVDTNNDGKADVIVVGTSGGGRVETPVDLDGDGKHEVVVSDPSRNPEQPIGIDVDNDGKIDVIIVGKRFEAGVHPPTDYDGDGDQEVVVSDPTRNPNNPTTLDLDNDGDADIIVVGTSFGTKVKSTADGDDDGEGDIVLEDPVRQPNQPLTIDLDNDGDADITIIGRPNPSGIARQLFLPKLQQD